MSTPASADDRSPAVRLIAAIPPRGGGVKSSMSRSVPIELGSIRAIGGSSHADPRVFAAEVVGSLQRSNLWLVGTAITEPTGLRGAADTASASSRVDRNLIACLWLLASQAGIASVSTTTADKQTRRRSERVGLSSDVRLVALRGGAASTGDGERRHRATTRNLIAARLERDAS
jgi:hypothetical protein